MSDRRKSMRTVAWLMDRSIPLPGGYRIGMDGFIGLIPGVGDFISSTVSGWLILKAHKEGAPKSVLSRMLLNVIIDLLIGSVPIVGDIFDFIFKANSRNLALLEAHHTSPTTVRQKSRWEVTAVIGVVFILMAMLIWGVFYLVALLWQVLFV